MVRFTPAETAILAGSSLKEVHRSIDTMILEAAGPVRRLSATDVVLIKADTSLRTLLPLETRRRVIEKLRRTPRASIIYEGEVLALDVKKLRRMIAKSMAMIRDLRHLAVSDPEIMSGEPVFRHTRIPVALIAQLIESGEPVASIREEYPALSERQVELASRWVQVYPQRGRPAARPWRVNQPVRTTRVALKAR